MINIFHLLPRLYRKFHRWRAHEELIERAIVEQQTKLARAQMFKEEFSDFGKLYLGSRRNLPLEWEDRYPCLDDKTSETAFDRHYTYHPAWAARVLSKVRPIEHVDISSTLQFCTLVSAFLPVRFYDFRPAPLHLNGITTGFADLLDLPFQDASIDSLSCMHVLEHIGLGRYGDRLDPNGDIQAIKELCRVLSLGGNLLVVVPVGKARIQFNAHRVYDHQEFVSYFSGLTLLEFSLIPDGDAPKGLILNPSVELVNAQSYGCGCYWFSK